MTKILVSDLYGTLISNDLSGIEYFYSRGNHLRSILELFDDKTYYNDLMNRAFVQLGRPLNEFLSKGNYLKIVTSMDSHDRLDFILDELITRFYDCIRNYKNHVTLFVSCGAGNKPDIEELSKKFKVYHLDSCFYLENKFGLSFYFINYKTDVFNFIKKQHDLENGHLFAIGDSKYDIPMLFKCIELGGKSSIINHYLFRCEEFDTGSIVKKTVSLNFEIMVEELANKKYYDFKNYELSRQMDIIDGLKEDLLISRQYNEWCYNEYNRIYNDLRMGEYDLNDLINKVMIFQIVKEYNSVINTSYFENYKTIDSKRVEELSIYPTFNDYYSKVLKR